MAHKMPPSAKTDYQSGKVKLLIGHYYLKFILLWQRYAAKAVIDETAYISESLVQTTFPNLKKLNQSTIFGTPTSDQTGITLRDQNSNIITPLLKAPHLASLLTELKVTHLKIDTRLESNQIYKSLTILFYIGKTLHRTQKSQSRLATTILSKTGLNAFCCNLQVDLTKKTVSITYSYCELFYSFMVKTILQKYTRTKNHQAIFTLAPNFGFLVGLLFFLHHLFWAPFSLVGVIAASLGAIGLGAGIAYLLNTLASTIYDQEYRDKLLQENIKEIRALSYFLDQNPNPIIKISQAGEIIFANDAAYKQAKAQGLDREKLVDILPKNFHSIVTDCLTSNREIREIDSTRHGRTVRFKISPFPNERAALIAGVDITSKRNHHDA